MKTALIRARDNNFRPGFIRGDAVRITDKKSPYLGHTGVILRMTRAALYGGQAAVIMDCDNKVVTIPVTTGTTKLGIKKFGFVKIPVLRIRVSSAVWPSEPLIILVYLFACRSCRHFQQSH